jgi:choice-of-anchor C domain-containing protein
MANDSTSAGVSSSVDTTTANENYFTDMQGEDAFFGPEQLAQADTEKVVSVPQGQNVIRVQVNPGEIIELSSPFDPGATLLAREGDGNLAIRVGDVTVILQGYVDANQAAPVVVQTSDGQPIDVAVLLASTDPAIDIQTAAGPGETGQGGQGADNTGAILSQLQGGNGLGGFDGVGAQDGTTLKYGLIDNSIQLDRDDNNLLLAGLTPFPGVQEPFLRDPFKTDDGSWSSFADFLSDYTDYINDNKDNTDKQGNPAPGGWADFTGTQADTSDAAGFLAATSYTVAVPHSSTTPERLEFWDGSQFFPGAVPTSNGEQLEARYLESGNEPTTVLLVRPSDGAIVMVFHILEQEASTGDFHVQVVLVNRLDHLHEGQDVLTVEFSTRIPIENGGEEQPEEQFQQQSESPYDEGPYCEEPQYKDGPDSSVDVLDDIPEAHGAHYASFLHATSYKDALSCLAAFTGGKIDDFVVTTDGGHVDEDYIFGGNHDKDNANGPDSDPARGDEFGDRFVVGILDINFGADGPSGKIPDPSKPALGDILFGPKEPALTVDLCEGDTFPGVTSGGHELKVLEKTTSLFGVEIVTVGYCDTSDNAKGYGNDVVVFTLVLQANPNVPLFGAFAFEICGPIDHPIGSAAETTLPLNIPVLATDDDGDHPLEDVNITILVNDDAPRIKDVEYISWKGGIPPCEDEPVPSLTLSGAGGNSSTIESDQYGMVDEDWLHGSKKNDLTPGNHDKDGNGDNNAGQDGDDYGKTKIKGEINVNFGGDGPAASDPFAFSKSYETSDPENLTKFANPDGTTFTSGGHDLVVLHSEEGFLQVGYLVNEGSEEEAEWCSVTIFTVEIDDSGCFEFQLCGPIDHDGENEQSLDLKIDVSVTDNDGDVEVVTLDFKVNDDTPEIGITYYNENPGDRITTLLPGGGVVTTHDAGKIDEDWLLAPNPDEVTNGSFEAPVVIGSFNTLNGPGGLDGWTIAGNGIDLINGYWPANDGDQSVDMNATNPGSIAKELTGLTIGQTYTITFDLTGNPEIEQGVKTLEVKVGGVYSATFTIDTTGYSLADMPPWQTYSFSFVASSTTETLTFTSLSSGPCGPVLDNVTLAANDLHIGNQDKDGNGDSNANQDGDTIGGASLCGQITWSFGGDGPGTATFGLSDYADGNPPFVNGGGQPTPTSGGHELVVLFSDANRLVVGYVLETTPPAIAAGLDPLEREPGQVTVFELTLDGSGHFAYTQYQPLDHPVHDGNQEDNLQLVFTGGSITDADGDQVTALIKIDVNDDTPENALTYTSHADTSEDGDVVSYDFGKVDEDFLGDPPANTDNDNDPFGHSDAVRGDDIGTNSCYGTIGAGKFGADGAGDAGSGFTLVHLAGDFTDADGNPVTQGGQQLVVLDSTDTHLAVGLEGGSPVFELNLNPDGTFNFQLYGPVDQAPGTDPVENNLMLAFKAGNGATDGDGDPVSAVIKIQVNDDAPLLANDADPTSDYEGNVMANDRTGADNAKVTGAVSVNGEVLADVNGDTHIQGALGLLILHANGEWTYTPDADKPGGSDEFTYHVTDGDGDSASATLTISVEPTAIPGRVPSPDSIHTDFDLTLSVTKNTDATDNKNYHAGDDVKITDTSTGLFGTGIGAGHTLKGGSGDDLIFGNAGGDDIYGRAGHDAQSGGDGADVFHNVDAEDLDGSHTLDGIHSIDGGDGYDTVELGGLKTFDSDQAQAIVNVEALNFDGKPVGADGTQVTLSYDAAYGITQVGGVHLLSITGDAGKDTVTLTASSGNSWVSDGEFFGTQFFHAGSGASKVSVTVESGINVDLS